MISKKIIQKCKLIKLVINDVDGVLTDGGMYYSEKGEILKKFNTKDGMGIELLHNASIKTIFVTGENSKIVKIRARKVKADDCYINIKQKEKIFSKICKKYNVKPVNVAYIGDDVNDLKIMNLVGLTACPSDAEKQIKLISDFECKKNGGKGAFREFTNIILDNTINS